MIKKPNNFIRFLGYVRPYTKYLILAILGGIIKFTVPLLVPQVTRHLLDNVFLNEALTTEKKLHELFFYTGGMMAIFVFVYAPGVYIRHLFADKVGHRAVFNLRCDLYHRILRMSASFFARNRSGGIISSLISDIQLAQNLVGNALANTWMDAAALVIILYFLFRIDVATTLVALATFPIYLFVFRKFSEEIRNTTRRVQDELSVMTSNAHERISGSAVVHAFTQERNERKRFENESEKLFSINMRRVLMQSLNQAITGTLTGLAPLIVVCYGGYRVISSQMTIGELIAITMYLSPLYLPLQRFSELNVVFANSMAALDRIYEIMDEEPEIVSQPDAIELAEINGDVTFDHVGFAYKPKNPVLYDITFKAQAGQKIALVGPSGSGKSTIVSLIPRFYDPNAGQVIIDKYDIRQIKVKSLRQHIGMVLQDPILFSGSIRENILYGNPAANNDEVIEASKAANAYDFITGLPNGFDTEVGERGAFLSGGQKQRITIARAFLKNPKILVFDEATSSLDSESERMIQDAMNRLIVGRTTFIIAHRLSTIIRADNILVIHKGRIVESGTHYELILRDGLYRELYEKQFGPLTLQNTLVLKPVAG
jgi:ATP-binding cassette, subfamily B, putative efflux pump